MRDLGRMLGSLEFSSGGLLRCIHEPEAIVLPEVGEPP